MIDLVLAVLVFAARPGRLQNRLLALFFFGLTLGWGFEGLSLSTTDPSTFYAAFATEQVAWLIGNLAYLAFLGTLDTPLSRPLGTRTARWVFVLLLLVGSVVFVRWTEAFWPGVGPGDISPLYVVSTPLGDAFWLMTGVVSTYALFVAILLVRRSDPGTVERSQAKAYLAAFALQDAPYAVGMFITFATTGLVVGRAFWLVIIVGYGLSAVLLAYGILKTQLFGIDLRVKWTLKRGTVVATLAAVFFVVKEGIEFLLPLEGLVPSLVGAALVAGLVYPVWRGAARVTEKMMPGVQDTPAYRASRSREIYRTAVEELAGEGISSRERRVLDALRAKLDITPLDAQAIEKGESQPKGMAG